MATAAPAKTISVKRPKSAAVVGKPTKEQRRGLPPSKKELAKKAAADAARTKADAAAKTADSAAAIADAEAKSTLKK